RTRSRPWDVQCLLGTADFRVATRSRRKPTTLAALHRYRTGVTGGRLPLGEFALSDADHLSSTTAFGGSALARASSGQRMRCASEVTHGDPTSLSHSTWRD